MVHEPLLLNFQGFTLYDVIGLLLFHEKSVCVWGGRGWGRVSEGGFLNRRTGGTYHLFSTI